MATQQDFSQTSCTPPPIPEGWEYVCVPKHRLWKLEEVDDDGAVVWSRSYRSQRDIARRYGVSKDFICQLRMGNMKHHWKRNAWWRNKRVTPT